jgi:perosamine synthetase
VPSDRSISPFFASMGIREVAALIAAAVSAPMICPRRRRGRLHEAVTHHFGRGDAFSFASARGALAACLKAAGIGPGDEVLLSSYTCLAVPAAVLAVGARPVYSDIDPSTGDVTLRFLEASLTGKTKAVVLQHTLGNVAPVVEVAEFARQRGLLLVEDCCLALGTRLKGRDVGTFGDAAIFSMELSKTLTVGWGGVLLVNDAAIAQAVEKDYRTVGQLSGQTIARMVIQSSISAICYRPRLFAIGKYVLHLGFKYGWFKPSTPASEHGGKVEAGFVAKLPGPQAALACRQWGRMDSIGQRCERNGRRLRECLQRLGYVPIGDYISETMNVSPRVAFVVADRAAVIEHFQRRGVYLGSWFDGPLSPLPRAPAYNFDPSSFPNAQLLARHVVNLCSHSALSERDLTRMEELMEAYASEHREDLVLQGRLQALAS